MRGWLKEASSGQAARALRRSAWARGYFSKLMKCRREPLPDWGACSRKADAARQAEPEKPLVCTLVSPVGVKAFVTGFNGTMGLGHIAAATPDLEASHRFFTEVMGFGQTDYLHLHFSPDPADPGQGLHFLHASNPRHHSLALFQSKDPMPGDLVHLMVEVPDLDTLGGFMDRVHSNGVRVITCLGRHTNDRMVSIYVETPAGFALEYGFDGLQLDWSTYVPTFSKRESHWGHRWGQG
mgnify:CR=1 FL=1